MSVELLHDWYALYAQLKYRRIYRLIFSSPSFDAVLAIFFQIGDILWLLLVVDLITSTNIKGFAK
jgi:hypothetical protein